MIRSRATCTAFVAAAATSFTPLRSRAVLSRVALNPVATKRKFWTIVPQKHVLGREFMGQERNIMEPGLRLLIPYLHQSELVDLREQPLSFKAMETTTSDNVAMIVDAVVFFQVSDPIKALYECADYRSMLADLTRSTLRTRIGAATQQSLNKDRAVINKDIAKEIGDKCAAWGLRVTTSELQNVHPKSSSIEKSAEVERTADFNHKATILDAKARKSKAEGEFEAAKLEADARAYAVQKQADAESYRISAIKTANQETIRELAELMEKSSFGEVAAAHVRALAQNEQLAAVAKNTRATAFMAMPAQLEQAKSLVPFADYTHNKQ